MSTAAQTCANEPTKLASLFSDDQNTMIRLSNPDLSDLRVLRTEPANVMPGMFDAAIARCKASGDVAEDCIEAPAQSRTSRRRPRWLPHRPASNVPGTPGR